MARAIPPDRLHKLMIAAAEVFIENGFQQTQMDEIAARMGVSKGTIYRSVESKEGLLAAVLTYADEPDRLPASALLSDDDLEQTAVALQSSLAQSFTRLELSFIVAGATVPVDGQDFGDEVERVALEVYQMMARHRFRIMVLDRCAREIPALAAHWFGGGRYAMVDLWAAFLEARSAHVDHTVDREVLARSIVELLTLWAVKMSWDPAPRPYSTDLPQACAAMVRNLITQGDAHASNH